MYIDSVIPLYLLEDTTKKYHSVGSAVLISHRSQFFFITAAHVIEKLKGQKAYMYFGRVFIDFGGYPAYLLNCSPVGERNKDSIDVAAMLLPEDLVEKSNNAKFITIDQYLSGMSVESPDFQALGYPHSKNTKSVRRTVRIPGGFRTQSLRLTVTDISDIVFPYKNFHKPFHIATLLPKTGKIQGSGEHVNIPDLHGMSGGLLQKVSNYNQVTDGFDCAYPAGIIIEKKKDNSAFFSLRLSAVFEWLDLHWEYILTDTAEVIKNTVKCNS